MAVINPFVETQYPNPMSNVVPQTGSAPNTSTGINPLLIQYLAAAGSDLLSGNPIGANVNKVTNQQIQNSSFQKLLQRMLGEAQSPNNTSKMTMDGTKFKFEGDMNNPFAQDNSNFQSSPLDFNSADLAGLTPEMISQALQFKFQKDQMSRQSVNDLVDRIYKGALTEQALASAEKMRNPPIKDTRTSDIKNYEFAQNQGFTGSFEDWQTTDTADWKDYQKAKGEGYQGNFYKWQKEMAALSGGLTLDEFAARKEVTSDIEARKYFTDPKGLAQDVDKHISSEEIQNRLFVLADKPREMQKQTLIEKAKFIEAKITSSGGKIEDVKMDGRTRVWKVKWPNGKTSEVRYAF